MSDFRCQTCGQLKPDLGLRLRQQAMACRPCCQEFGKAMEPMAPVRPGDIRVKVVQGTLYWIFVTNQESETPSDFGTDYRWHRIKIVHCPYCLSDLPMIGELVDRTPFVPNAKLPSVTETVRWVRENGEAAAKT